MSPTTRLNKPGNVEEGGFSAENIRNEGELSSKTCLSHNYITKMWWKLYFRKLIVNLGTACNLMK